MNRISNFIIGLVVALAAAAVVVPVYSGPIVMEPSFSDGTAALPSIKNIGDEDTGMWFPADNTAAISTNGVEAIRWNSSQQTLLPNGSASAPALAFASATGVGLFRESGALVFVPQSNILDQRSGTNPQQLNIYGTFTDANNYERLELVMQAGTDAFIRMANAGTGATRVLAFRYANSGARAIAIPTSTSVQIAMSNADLTSVAANGRVLIAGSLANPPALSTNTSTSGTSIGLNYIESFQPTAASTMTAVGFRIAPTVNYSGGGAGSYEAIRVAITETALPTGKNYLARFLAGSAGTQDIFAVTNTTHIETGQATAPTLSACGTTPSIVGTDTNGKVTVGTGVTTSCTLTFGTAFTNAPACTVSGDNTAVTYIATTSTTALTITSSADMASDVVSYICMGRV